MWKNNAVLDKRVISEIEILEDYQEIFNSNKSENIDLEYSDVLNNFNISNLYFNEIKSIPLLLVEEEIKLGNDLKLLDDIIIVTDKSKKSNECVLIDLDLVFKLCCGNRNYRLIIDLLLLHFGTNAEIFYKNLYPIIFKYDKISKKLGRALNEMELKEYLGIKNDIDVVKIDEDELVVQVEKYLKYKNAFDRLFRSNLRLVAKIASKYNSVHVQFLDLVNEGNIGLMTAIRRYDVSLGYKFSTYATWWIVHCIRVFSINQRTMVKVPFYLSEEYLSFKKNYNRLQQENFGNLSNEEISEKLNISLNKVRTFMSLSHDCKTLSLDLTIDDKNDNNIGYYIKNDVEVENEVVDSMLKYEIKELYKNLTDKELEVIKMRFGLDDYHDRIYSLKEIGNKYGITQERVRQIEAKALTKMRRLTSSKRCRDLVEYLK